MAKIVSTKAELAVLRGMCSKDRAVVGTLVGSLDESFFHSDDASELYNYIVNHINTEGGAPKYRLMMEDTELSESARQYLRDSEATITTMKEAQKAVRILNKYRQRRGLYNIGAHIADQFKDPSFDTETLLDKISQEIAAIRAKKNNKDSAVHFGKNNNSLGLIEDILFGEDQEQVIPTGFKNFDDVAGGFARGSLVTVASTSGGGKSIMAGQLCKNMAERGYKVLLVPLEMSKWQMAARIMANVTDVELTPILRKTLTENEKELVNTRMKKWLKKVKKRGGRYTIFKPDTDMTIEEIYASIASFGCDVVIIDYISLLKGTDGDDMWRALGKAARYGKINAEGTHRVNVLICQLDEDGRIRYSRAVTEHSSNSWTWKNDKETKASGMIKIEQPKSRNSESFPFAVEVVYNKVQMKDAKTEDFGNEDLGKLGKALPDLAQSDV